MPSERTEQETLLLAKKILAFSRKRISTAAPLMLAPIYALQETPRDAPGPMATDGTHLFFNPRQVVETFRVDRDGPARQLLHVTIHCLLGHVALRRDLSAAEPVFDALADGKVHWFLTELLDMRSFNSLAAGSKHGFSLQSDSIGRPLPALFHQIHSQKREIKSLMRGAHYFAVDNHQLWSPPSDDPQPRFLPLESSSGQERGGLTIQIPATPQAPDWRGMLQGLCEQALHSPQWRSAAGALQQELGIAEENELSYTAFLKRFAFPQERLLLDPDSFDPRWYHLGMDLYGDIPLLEPSEISEPPLPDELVIALDTSGSCSGETCRRFLRETMNLLRDITTGITKFRLLLLQCDTAIQQELLLETSDQIETLLVDFTPQGFGGTDFRPVFQRVEQLQMNGTLNRVRGLLYLSDTYGAFPDKAPDYPVAFLAPLEGCPCDFSSVSHVPDWVTTLLLDPNEFTVKEAHTA